LGGQRKVPQRLEVYAQIRKEGLERGEGDIARSFFLTIVRVRAGKVLVTLYRMKGRKN